MRKEKRRNKRKMRGERVKKESFFFFFTEDFIRELFRLTIKLRGRYTIIF